MTLGETILSRRRSAQEQSAPTVPVDVASAVPPFVAAKRLAVHPPILTPAQSTSAIAWNVRNHATVSGVQVTEILSALASYVEAAPIRSAIAGYNTANPTNQIAAGSGTINAVFVECVHQFQKKCFRETNQHDGKAGESTLDSLGLVTRTGMHSWNTVNPTAQSRLNTAGAEVGNATANEFTHTNWFQHMTNSTVFGETFNRGIHQVLLRKLRHAERHLLTLAAYRTMTPVELGRALGLGEKHKGSRPAATTGSMHTFGLAVDIAYTANPWIRSTSSRDAIRRASLLTNGVVLSRARITQEFHAFGSDASLSSGAAYDRIAALDAALRTYLSLETNQTALRAAIQARIRAGVAGIVDPGETEAAAVARWSARIATDRAALAAGDFRHHDPPAQGFLGLPRDLVSALRDQGCLAWGGSDLGGGAWGSGDMMHFDARANGVGRLLAGIPAPSGANFVPITGHPCVPAAPAPAEQLTDQVAGNPPPPRYGGFDLQRGDSDTTHTWGGVVRTGNASHVRDLQRDLRTLGFRIIDTASGVFDRDTEWAVREFQVYCKMEQLATENVVAPVYADRLSAARNTRLYAGSISGVLNATTRALMGHWITNNLRCPVVVEAWNMRNGQRDRVHAENIWKHDDVTATAPRMFVKDLSGYYTLPAAHRAADRMVLGDFARYLRWEGPRSVPPHHTVAEAEVLPDHLVGSSLATLTAEQRSTFKVIRSVSEVECLGFLDSVNSYDNAFVSVGPSHWTLGIANSRGSGRVDRGELSAYLAYLHHADTAAYDEAFGFFGVHPERDWVSAGGVANGARLFSNSQHKYTSWVQLENAAGAHTPVPRVETDGDYFKTWHWFYRFVMAGRAVEGYRRRMWDMARIRVRDLRDTPFPAATVPDILLATGSARRSTIGDVFTSERATALLMRWHIRSPASIVARGVAGPRVLEAVRRAAIPATAGDPTRWNDRYERALIRGIMAEAVQHMRPGFQRSLRTVRDFPTWVPPARNPRGFALDPTIGAMADTRGSFAFDTVGLPPRP